MENRVSLFSFEGPEGSGKTLIASLVAKKLNELNNLALYSREPGGVEVAEDIRGIVVHKEMHRMTEALLFLAARVEHYNKIIRPHIDLGYTVILDRFIYSTLAIQGNARGIPISTLKELHRLALPKDIRFITFYLDIDPRISVARKSSQDNEVQKFEREPMEFHYASRDFMLEQCQENPEEVIRIAVDHGTPDEIADEIVNIILHIQGKEN